MYSKKKKSLPANISYKKVPVKKEMSAFTDTLIQLKAKVQKSALTMREASVNWVI